MKSFALAVLSAAVLSLSAMGSARAAELPVGPPAIAPPATLSDWSPEDMKSILTEVGAKILSEGKNEEGEPFIKAQSAEGLQFTVFGAACDVGAAKRCRGAEIYTYYTLDSEEAVEAKVKSLDFVAVTITNGGDKSLDVYRYLIFDHGIARENVKLNLTVFLEIAQTIWDGL